MPLPSINSRLKQCAVVLESMKINSVSDNTHEDLDPALRKSARSRVKPKKYSEFLDNSPARRKRGVAADSSDDVSSSADEEAVCSQKPSALFDNDDVEGQNIFKFKSRHTKNDLHNAVQSAICNSPKVSESPLRSLSRKSLAKASAASPIGKLGATATPKHVRDIMKKRIIQEIASDSSEDGDFSASSDEFVPDGVSGDESESSQSSSDSEEAEVEPKAKPQVQAKVQVRRNREGKPRQKDSEYIVTPDNYFMMHSSKKIVTSDHTLERLKNLHMNENMEHQEDIQLSEEHKNKIVELNESYKHLFDRWLYVLSENFNIVLYGVGSKRAILHQFQEEKLQDCPCIVVNGFFPSLTMKSILEAIVVDLLECSHVPSNIGDVISLIDAQLSESQVHLFLIIHNIDGTMLRNAKAQSMLASLSQIKNVHTLATIDHINAPLLWDHSKLSKFNFTWWDVTTFLPYMEETSYENSLMSHRSEALQLSSLRSVYQSLTSNAKGIFNIIIQYQLDNHKQNHYQGLPFRELYSKSREQFLVSSDIALRAQLTEFLDHKLAKLKRSYDGSENLVIPIDNSLLQHFLEQQNA